MIEAIDDARCHASAREHVTRFGSCPTEPAMARRDAGISLVEILVGIVVLGTVAAAVLVGLSTAIIGADRHRDMSAGMTVMVDGLEFVKTRPFSTCGAAPSAYMPPSEVRGGLTWTSSVTVVSSSNGTYGGSCNDAHALQKVTVTVSSSDGRTSLTREVVKRDD